MRCPTNNAKRAKHSKILKPGCFFVFTNFYQLAYCVLCGLSCPWRELENNLGFRALPRELAMSLNRATQPVSPGGVEHAQWHKPASLSSESAENLRHVGCYPTVVGGEAG
jgi:hypothetical protein